MSGAYTILVRLLWLVLGVGPQDLSPPLLRFPIPLHECGILFRRIDPRTAVLDHRDGNPFPHVQGPELLQLLDMLQFAWRRAGRTPPFTSASRNTYVPDYRMRCLRPFLS